MAAPTTRVPLTALLSTCVDACARACDVIRAVQAKRASGVALNVSHKEDDDPRSALTEADTAAQAVVVASLRAAWPGLRIVGEEDDDDVAASAGAPATPPLRTDLCVAAESSLTADLEHVTVFVDPLDGTREFVEGRLANVLSLIGIAVRGRAVGGAIGVPFAHGDVHAERAVVYGLVGAGSGAVACVEGAGAGEASFVTRPLPDAASAADAGEARPVVMTGDSKDAILAAARTAALADGGRAVFSGGAGSKLLAAALGRCDLAIMHCATHLWDTCAPEAVLCARGGRVTDLFGSPLVHCPSTPIGSTLNAFGVLGSAPGAPARAVHDSVAAAMRASPVALRVLERWAGEGVGVGSHAADVARGLDGAPLRVEWLSERLGDALGTSTRLRSYVADEPSAARGLMSDAVRLSLRWDAGAAEALPRSVFFKRVCMGELAHARAKAMSQPDKLRRDSRSFGVEVAFLGSDAAAELSRAGVPVPRTYAVESLPDEAEPIESRFALLVSDFAPADGWRQEWLLGGDATRAALGALAKLHAYFWHGSAFWRRGGAPAAELVRAVWASGGYVQPYGGMQPREQIIDLASLWERNRQRLGADFADMPELAGVDVGAIGARLQEVADAVAAEAHPFGAGGECAERAGRYRTLVHGDPKHANVFIRDGAGGALEAGLIDFQWCGFGLAATDVAHHLAAAPRADVLRDGGEAALLDHYHAELCRALGEFGAAGSAAEAARLFPRTTLQTQFEAATLDMCRIVFAYQWSRFTRAAPGDDPAKKNNNAYNKCVDSAAALVARCDALLRARSAARRAAS